MIRHWFYITLNLYEYVNRNFELSCKFPVYVIPCNSDSVGIENENNTYSLLFLKVATPGLLMYSAPDRVKCKDYRIKPAFVNKVDNAFGPVTCLARKSCDAIWIKNMIRIVLFWIEMRRCNWVTFKSAADKFNIQGWFVLTICNYYCCLSSAG